MTKIKKFVNNYIPIFAIISFAVALVSFVILEISKTNIVFAEFISSTIGEGLRVALNFIFGWLPFSFSEIMLMSVPLVITALVIYIIRAGNKQKFIRLLLYVLGAVLVFYSLYVYTIGAGYHRESVAPKLEITDENPSKNELYDTLLHISGELDKLLPYVQYQSNGASVDNRSAQDISAIVMQGYDKVMKDYPALGLGNFKQQAKPVIMSKGMTYLELLGIYTYFTGESCVNVHYPDYTLPFSIAHEFAHARGIARENEANFIAYLVCISSPDPYVQYSGYLNMYEYMASALGRTDNERLKQAYALTDTRVLGEIIAYSDFYYENQIKWLGDLSDFVNDNYLKANGTVGIVSYGLAVRLCVSYHKNKS